MTFGVFKELGHDFDGITFHHLFERPHPDHTPDQDRADLWSFAVAHAADFNFSYAFLVEMVNRRTAAGLHPIPTPTALEFLDLLEFRLTEQERVLAGDDPYWQWPSTWPAKPSWNGHVLENPRGAIEPLEQAVDATRKGIHVHKIALGHGRELALDHWALELVSGLQRRFLELPEFCVGYRPLVPLVISSLDLPVRARVVPVEDNCQVWDIDGTLGEFHGGDAVTIYVRAVERCADALRLPHRDLFLIVLVHEVAHFLVHSLPDGKSESKREPWLREAYEKTTSQFHEGFAQLLTHLTVGRFNDHHSRTFETLVASQSRDYQTFRDVLAVTDDENRLLRSLVQLRLNPNGATMSDWLAILRQ
jgi:hypothetical protein